MPDAIARENSRIFRIDRAQRRRASLPTPRATQSTTLPHRCSVIDAILVVARTRGRRGASEQPRRGQPHPPGDGSFAASAVGRRRGCSRRSRSESSRRRSEPVQRRSGHARRPDTVRCSWSTAVTSYSAAGCRWSTSPLARILQAVGQARARIPRAAWQRARRSERRSECLEICTRQACHRAKDAVWPRTRGEWFGWRCGPAYDQRIVSARMPAAT